MVAPTDVRKRRSPASTPASRRGPAPFDRAWKAKFRATRSAIFGIAVCAEDGHDVRVWMLPLFLDRIDSLRDRRGVVW
jgi:hypothetical protein